MGLRRGDMIKSKINGIEGILLNILTSKYNSYFHKAEIFCTYSPHNPQYIGKLIVIDENNLVRKY